MQNHWHRVVEVVERFAPFWISLRRAKTGRMINMALQKFDFSEMLERGFVSGVLVA
jgi:hypothetical protein